MVAVRPSDAPWRHDQEGTMSPDNGKDGDGGLKLSGGAIASLSGVALLVIFMLQNTERAPLRFLVWKFTWPVWLLVLLSALLGAFVWFGLGVLRRHNRRKERRADR
jgi:uncharacterized integral membrane protein